MALIPPAVADFCRVMEEFRANGRESPLEKPPPERAPLSPRLEQRRCPPPPSPTEAERRGVLWSRHWQEYRDNRDIYNSHAVYFPEERVIYGREDATGAMYARAHRTEGPYGYLLLADGRPASVCGGGESRARPPTGDNDPALHRQPRGGRATGRKRTKQPNHCVFCKNNNELPCVYRNHILKVSGSRPF